MNSFTSQPGGWRKSVLIFATTLLIVAGAGRVHAQPQTPPAPSADKTYSVTRVYKAGDVDRYSMKMIQKLDGLLPDNQTMTVTMNIVMKETTKSATADGLTTIMEEYTKADADMNGMPMDMLPMMPKVTVKANKGAIVDVSADGGQEPATTQIKEMARSMLQSQSSMLPKKPVKIGDSWKADVIVPADNVDTAMTVTTKLDGVETIGGVSALRLKSTTDTKGGAGSDTNMHGESTIYVNAATGKPVKMSSTASGTTHGLKVSVQMTMETASADTDKAPVKKKGPS